MTKPDCDLCGDEKKIYTPDPKRRYWHVLVPCPKCQGHGARLVCIEESEK